jgi:hypothetical protein
MLNKLRCKDDDLWGDLWGSICHQGTVYTATYAAVPHLVDMLQTASEAEELDFIVFLGTVAASLDRPPIPKHLEPEYTNALQVTAEIARGLILSRSWEKGDYIYLLQAVAGLHGCQVPGQQLENLQNEQYETYCLNCNQFLVVSVREAGFFTSASDQFYKPLSDEVEVKPRIAIDEPWDGTIDCADNFRWLYGISCVTGHTDVAFWLRCLYGETTCPICNGTFNLMESIERQYF